MKGVSWDPETKNLVYDLWDAQEKALNLFYSGDYQIINFRAGFRSGKSIAGARGILNGAYNIPDSRWLVMSESYQEGKKTTYRILFEQLPEYDGDDPESSPIVDSYHKNDKILKLTNGSTVILGTADSPNKHKGDEFAGIWCDEVAFYSNLYKLSKMLLSRLSADNGPLTMIWTTTTDGFNDYWQISEQGVIPHEDKDHGWNIETVIADSRNNPFLSDEAMDNLEQTHQQSAIEGLKGGFQPAEGRVYGVFDRNTHVFPAEKVDLVPDWRIYAYDAGWDDPKVALEIGKTHLGQLVVVDEFVKSEAHTEEVIEWLRDKPSGHLYSEHQPDDIDRMRKELPHIVVKKANKDIDTGIQKVQERIDLDNEGIAGLIILERCKHTIKEFLSYTKDEVGSNTAEDHCMDCIRYAINSPQRSIMNRDNTNQTDTTSISVTSGSRKDIKDNLRNR